jgi:hypothetical protein
MRRRAATTPKQAQAHQRKSARLGHDSDGRHRDRFEGVLHQRATGHGGTEGNLSPAVVKGAAAGFVDEAEAEEVVRAVQEPLRPSSPRSWSA